MTKITRITILASSLLLPCAVSDSFSGLNYSSSQESANYMINTLLGDDNDIEIIGGTTSTTSTVESAAFISGDGDGDSYSTPSTAAAAAAAAAASTTTSESGTPPNVCATSLLDAQSKACGGNSTTCVDVRDCPYGEACFLSVVCASNNNNNNDTGKNENEYVNATRGDAGIISNFVLLGTSSNGNTMTSMSEMDLTSNSSSPIKMGDNSTSTDVGGANTDGASVISTRVEEALLTIQQVIDTQIFLYETPLSEWIPSTVYRFQGFFEGLKIMHTVGVAGKKIYMGRPSGEEDTTGSGDAAEDCPHCFMYGLVNIAAFLAQAMKETIRYDACDENSWDRVGSLEMYPIRRALINHSPCTFPIVSPFSNSCGQLGQSYQDYHCSEEEKHMECAVDPDMTITAVTHAKWWGAPGPLMCGPKSLYPQTGYWDYQYECNNPWGNPPETCDAYPDQKAGKAINDEPYPNAAGRTDIEGCCWWGRGVIQTSGICNFGKLNYYLGKRAFLEGRDSRYPDIDFCRDPEIICTSEENKELKWIGEEMGIVFFAIHSGFFYWVDQVQPYDSGGWNYLAELKKFVNGGMEGEEFINSVSGIVNRGCHNPPCGTGDLDGGPERAENFFRILEELEFSFVDIAPTSPPVESPPVSMPTPLPTPSTPAPVSATVSYTCGDESQTIDGESPPSIEVAFDYEMHSILDVPVSQALEEVKSSILSDVAQRLGCTESTGRRLQDSSGNIIGFMSSRSDMPDPDAAGCLVEVDLNVPAVCTPIRGEITVFAEPGTSDEDLQSTSDYLKSTIKDGMDTSQYESKTVKRVTWIGDREIFLEALNPPSPPAIKTELPPPDTGTDWTKIALYSLAGVCAFLLCLLCMIIPTRRKSFDHDEELAMVEYMNAHRESYKERTTPRNAIERRSEHLRAVQQGRPLQSPYLLENGTATSESDDESSYSRRRHSRRYPVHANHHQLVEIPPPPPPAQNRDFRRNTAPPILIRRQGLGSAPPIQTIGETGEFYVKDPRSLEVGDVIVPPDPNESMRSFGDISYQPQEGGGVESVHGDNSSKDSSESEEERPPVVSQRHRGSDRGIERSKTHDPQLNAERRQRTNRETWAHPQSNAMSKEERQRRIDKARANRRSVR
eukprot:CCRYP_010316-RB/>CCRYP_010316-RB protein AED:0.11 eAED:0.11 QI:0/0.66/0.57/1/0.66/0.57/7/100/1125